MSTLYSREVQCSRERFVEVYVHGYGCIGALLSCYSTCGDSCTVDVDENSIVRIIDALNEALTVLKEAKSNEQ